MGKTSLIQDYAARVDFIEFYTFKKDDDKAFCAGNLSLIEDTDLNSIANDDIEDYFIADEKLYNEIVKMNRDKEFQGIDNFEIRFGNKNARVLVVVLNKAA